VAIARGETVGTGIVRKPTKHPACSRFCMPPLWNLHAVLREELIQMMEKIKYITPALRDGMVAQIRHH
jgi:hypothetical protein